MHWIALWLTWTDSDSDSDFESRTLSPISCINCSTEERMQRLPHSCRTVTAQSRLSHSSCAHLCSLSHTLSDHCLQRVTQLSNNSPEESVIYFLAKRQIPSELSEHCELRAQESVDTTRDSRQCALLWAHSTTAHQHISQPLTALTVLQSDQTSTDSQSLSRASRDSDSGDAHSVSDAAIKLSEFARLALPVTSTRLWRPTHTTRHCSALAKSKEQHKRLTHCHCQWYQWY